VSAVEPHWERLTPADVDDLTVEVLRRAWRARPEVRHIRLQGEEAVVKDYGRGGSFFKRWILGTFLARREATALRRAEGIPNIPRVLATPQPWSIVIEYVESTPVTALRNQELAPEFFEALSRMVECIHQRGMAHGDLEKLDNVLVTPEGEPALVDFAAAIIAGANPLAALALPYIRENDRRAICKLKQKFAPELLTDDERERLQRRSTAEVWFRRVRKYIRRPVKTLAGVNGDRD